MSHTPGPWWVTDYGIRDRGGYICETRKPAHYQGQDERYASEVAEREANKILIAAAPEFLDALKAVAALEVEPGEILTGRELTKAVAAAKAAIAKATGATP